MRSVLIYFFPFLLIAACFRIFGPEIENSTRKNLPSQQAELVIKPGTPDGSSANINEVEVLINSPVVKKLAFALVCRYPADIELHFFRNIQPHLTSLLHSSQLLFLAHCLLLL